MKKIKFLAIYFMAAIVSFGLTACSSDDSDTTEISEQAKALGLSDVQLNQDANSPEIGYFVTQTGDTITMVGEKDDNGCTTDINILKFNTSSENITIRFDENKRPELLTYGSGVQISLDWIDEVSAAVKAYDPETNTYVSTIWYTDSVPPVVSKSAMPSKVKTSTKVPKRQGNVSMKITPYENKRVINSPTRATAVEDLMDQLCVFSVTQCGSPKDVSTWISLRNAKTGKFIQNIDYTRKVSTGVYNYVIPASSYPAKATNKDVCRYIDYGLHALQGGCTIVAGVGGLTAWLTYVTALTGIGAPPAAVLSAITATATVGAASLEVFLAANGTSGLMETFNPKWYYREYVISDLELHPYIITSTDVIDCEKMTLGPEDGNIEINYDIDGEPTIDDFSLNPSHPAAGQGYVATATFHCVPTGSQIEMSIIGTDGYTNSETSTISTSNGTAELYVPGAVSGVYDVCKVVITPEYGTPISMTASLVFGE